MHGAGRSPWHIRIVPDPAPLSSASNGYIRAPTQTRLELNGLRNFGLACDLRIIASDAQLIVVFVRVGLVPDAGSLFFLTRMVAFGKAMELALTGNPLGAVEAQQLGLVSAVVSPGDLMSVAAERASTLSAGPAQAYALIKRGMERALSLDLEQALELEAHLQSLAARAADHQDAVRAFLEKRKPVFGSAK